MTCSRRLHESVPLTECVAKRASRARAPWLARSGSGPGMACWVVERPRRTAPIRCALLPDPSRGRVPSRLQPRSPPTLGQLVHGGGGGHRGSGDAWARTYSLSLKRVEGCGCRLSHTDQVIRWGASLNDRPEAFLANQSRMISTCTCMHTMCMCMCTFVVFRFDHARCGTWHVACIYLLFAQNGPPSAASLVQHATTLSVVRATYTEMFTPGSNFFRGMVWYGPRRAYQGMVFRGGGYGPDRPRLAYHTPKQICQQAGGVVSRWSLDICTSAIPYPAKSPNPTATICIDIQHRHRKDSAPTPAWESLWPWGR